MKKAIITGITGQDGYLLSKYLKKKNYIILGLSRKQNKDKKILKTNYSKKSIEKIIDFFKPDEIYNLTGFTNPSKSWVYPQKNFFANLNITLNFLETLRNNTNIKFFNASSSEIFSDSNNLLNENSKIFPINPYGIAKSASYFLVNAYRKKYGLFLINAILFNHTSYNSNETFLLKHLLSSCKKLKQNKIKKINIKDSRPIRDFGCAKDYVTYFHQLMQIKQPSDFVIASGKSYSVKQITDIYRKKFNLSPNVINFKNELNFKNLFKTRRANNNKLMKTLKIRSTKKLPDVIDTMIIDLK
jgi:GDPmannose 4,6-dehydratase